MPKKQQDKVEGEHIFPNNELQIKALQWQEATEIGDDDQAMELLEEIIEKSTMMFQRLAQYENYHHTVDLGILVSAAQSKVVRWLQGWKPEKGKLFSWFSTCAKHAFLSELHKVNQYRTRYHVTSDNLDTFYGSEDHAVHKRNAAVSLRKKINELSSRWGSPQAKGALRYALECIVDDGYNRQNCIRGIACAWGTSLDVAKVYHSWAMVSLRDQMFTAIRVPWTEQDLFRARNSYEQIVDLLDNEHTPFTFGHIKYLCAVFGGSRLKIPTLAQIEKTRKDHLMFEEIESSDKDPESVSKIGKKYGKSPRAASETYYEMVEQLDPARCGEHQVYEDGY